MTEGTLFKASKILPCVLLSLHLPFPSPISHSFSSLGCWLSAPGVWSLKTPSGLLCSLLLSQWETPAGEGGGKTGAGASLLCPFPASILGSCQWQHSLNTKAFSTALVLTGLQEDSSLHLSFITLPLPDPECPKSSFGFLNLARTLQLSLRSL